jgi:hypothetical protein
MDQSFAFHYRLVPLDIAQGHDELFFEELTIRDALADRGYHLVVKDGPSGFELSTQEPISSHDLRRLESRFYVDAEEVVA